MCGLIKPVYGYYCSVILIILIILSLKLTKEDKTSHSVIPLNIFQTWHTKELPPRMKKNIEKLKKTNPSFTHYLYDIEESRNFIKDNFDASVLAAYDKIVPPAYKSDLWRLCILYKKGGIYLDVKLCCAPDFDLSELVDKEYFVLDRPYVGKNFTLQNELDLVNQKDYYKNMYNKIDPLLWENKKIGIYNALIVAKPGNKFLLDCINHIIKNANNDYYGFSSLSITGPQLLGDIYFDNDYTKIDSMDLFNSSDCTYIFNRHKKIMTHYPEYRAEQKMYGLHVDYHKLWKNRLVYN